MGMVTLLWKKMSAFWGVDLGFWISTLIYSVKPSRMFCLWIFDPIFILGPYLSKQRILSVLSGIILILLFPVFISLFPCSLEADN